MLIKVCYHNGNYEMSKWLSYKEIQDDAKEKWDSVYLHHKKILHVNISKYIFKHVTFIELLMFVDDWY